MIISKATAKTKLEVPITQLKEWENSVPVEAKKFHLYRRTLLSRINKLLSGKLPFLKKNEVEVLAKRYTQINSILADLTTFFEKKTKLEGDITQCQQRKLNQGDQKLRYWLAEHCNNWQKQLSKLGSDSLREGEINADEAELSVILEEFTLYDKAVHLFQKANDILATLDSGIDTAQLETELPLLKQRLLENNLDKFWLEELEALVSPLIPKLLKIQEVQEQSAEIINVSLEAEESQEKKMPLETIKDIKPVILPKIPEISIDSTLIRQWFSSKAHLPVMRDYTHPLLDELSLSHTAPEQLLQIAKLKNLSSPKIIPVNLKSENKTSSYSSPKIIPVDLQSENYRNSDSSSKIVFVDLQS